MPIDSRENAIRPRVDRAGGERILVGLILAAAAILACASIVTSPDSSLTLVMAALYGAVGSLLAIRRSRNPIGWLFLGVLLVFTISTAADGLGGTAAKAGSPLPGGLALVLIWAETWAYAALFGIYYGLTVVFPSGHLPLGRARPLVRVSLLVPLAAVAATAFGPYLGGNFSPQYTGHALDNPAALLPVPEGLAPLLELATVGLLVCGIVSMVVRFGRARGIERQQLKWLVASLALTGVLVIATVALVLLVPRVGTAVWIFAVLGYATIPPAVGVAVLRYRLYELDRIVSRTLSWAVVTGTLAGCFVLLVVGLQSALAQFTGANTLAVAGSTLVVFGLFSPLRHRVQRLVDRRFDRDRYDGELTVTTLIGRLRDETDLEQVSREVVTAIRAALAPTTTSIWLRSKDVR